MADLDQEIRRAHEAELLMANPMLRDALKKMGDATLAHLIKANVNDDKLLKTLVIQYQVVNSFEKELKTTMDTGKLAAIQKKTLLDQAKGILRKVTG